MGCLFACLALTARAHPGELDAVVVDPVARRLRSVLVQPLLHGDRDKIVPIAQGRRLFEAANPPKEFVVIPGADHNDAWIVGGFVEPNSKVADNAYVCGATVDIAKGASVGKDLIAAAGNLGVAGRIGRDLRASGRSVTIAGTVNGNVYARAQQLRIAKGALVKGNLFYESPNKAIVDPRARIMGETMHRLPRAERMRPVFWPRLAGWIGQLIAAILFGAVLLILFPARVQEAAEGVRQSFWLSLGVGLVVLIAAPVAIVVLAITLVGIPLAIAGLMVYGILLYSAWIFAGLALGQGLLGRARPAPPKPLGSMILGLALLALACLIPIVGGLVMFVAMTAGLGAFLTRWWRSTRRTEVGPEPAEAA